MSLDFIGLDSNQNKKVFRVAGATLGQGVPLGAWCSFEKDVAPSSNWLMAGTTFDATVYPALNLYLGTNKVPSRYDHNRLGDWETITLPTTSVNAMTMEYDGELYVMVTNANNTITQIYVNTLRYDIGATAGGIGGSVPIIIPVKKGDTVYQGGSVTQITTRLAYYTHPLFIKATSIASDSDKDSILAQIQEYNTYSTEETLTGKTWIDGKKIYRKCTKIITNSVLAPNITFSGNDRYHYMAGYTNNAETITSVVGVEERTNGNNQTVISGNSNLYVVLVSTTELAFSDFINAKELTIILEYTKTTD